MWAPEWIESPTPSGAPVGGAQPGQDLRGTLHLLPSDKLPPWQAARSTTRLWETGAWQRGFGVTPGELGRLNDAVAQALDSQLLTREELADRTGELTGSELLGDKLRESWGRCSSRPPRG